MILPGVKLSPFMLKLSESDAVPAVVLNTWSMPLVVRLAGGAVTLKVDEITDGAISPVWSVAVPGATIIPMLPEPVIPKMLTVYVLNPLGIKFTEPLALPVVFSVIFDCVSVLL